jgi:hypothetical protein
MSLRNNIELFVRELPASKIVNTDAEGGTALEAVTRQPVKAQETENN